MTTNQIATAANLGENPSIKTLSGIKGFKSMIPAIKACIATAQTFNKDLSPLQAIDLLGGDVKAQFAKSAMASVRAGSIVRITETLSKSKHMLKEIADELKATDANRVSVAFEMGLDGIVKPIVFAPVKKTAKAEKQDSHSGNAPGKQQAKTYAEVNGNTK